LKPDILKPDVLWVYRYIYPQKLYSSWVS
jgi:hypothetical protein